MSRKLALIVLSLLGILAGISIYLASKQKFDYDFEKYFPKGDPELEYYLKFRETFGSDNDYLLLAIENQKGAFRPDFLAKADSLISRLEKIKHITKVISPVTMKKKIIGPFGEEEYPLINRDSETTIKQDSLGIFQVDELPGNLLGRDGKSLLVYVETIPHLEKSTADSLLNQVELAGKSFAFDGFRIGGKIRIYNEYVTRMLTDFFTFVGASLFMIILFLIIAFRSAWGVWVPVLTVLFAVVWILAAMTLAGQPIDLIMTMLPTFIFVVGMSDVVHIISEYLDNLRKGQEKQTALRNAYREVGLATLLTCITTAAGFLTLLTANIIPIQNFGLYTALGVVLAYILAFTFLPAVLSLLPKPKVAERDRDKVFWTSLLSKLFLKVVRRPGLILLIYSGLILIAVLGIMQIKINRFFLEDLPDSHQLKQDFAYFEKNYSGLKPFEMTITVRDSSRSVWSPVVLRETEKVESYLKEKLKLGAMITPLTAVRGVNQALHGGEASSFALPPDSMELRRALKFVKLAEKKGELKQLVSADRKTARLTGKGADIGSYESKILLAEFDRYFKTEVDTNLLAYRITGGAYLVDINNESLSKDLGTSMFFEFAVVAVIVGFLFFSLRMVVISIVPNLVPLVLVAGFMGWMGIPLKVTTSMIFSIVFGIAVDDTLHILTRLRIELGKGRSPMFALRRAYVGTGKAVLVTSAILVGGFLSPMLSSFDSIFYVGLLVCLALLMAVLADLFLLPILLLGYFRISRNKYKKGN